MGGQRGRVRDPKRLLINADMALFRAKAEGRARYAVFTSAMAEEARRQNERSIALGDALHGDAFRPWFQPMIDLETNRVVGLEMLARWHDPERGVLMPNDFLEDAESISLMEEIGLQVLERGLDALRNWRNMALEIPVIHLNLSRTQLLSSSFVDRVSWALDEANISPEHIAVEVDERDCGARGGEVAVANVNRLRQTGVAIVLDNFGTDRASLANIGPLGAKCMKCSPFTIERMFGKQSEDTQVRVLSALNIAAGALGISIRANGIETQEQSAFFGSAGVQVQQGDHLATVMDIEQTAEFIRSQQDALGAEVRKVS
ncbi:MAG: GGDEF domain-containing phosphodiesterase [Pseudomonadota bacterium]